MAEDKKTFLQGKMNQDIDSKILPNGEYRSAQNIEVTTSDESNVGAITNLLGNTKVTNPDFDLANYSGLETIGFFADEKNNRIFYFVTNYTCPNPNAVGLVGDFDGPLTAQQQDNNDLFCAIYVYQNDPVAPTISKLASGLFLNFSKTNIITGVNVLEDLLFWTDNLNQPRKINIRKALANQNHYNTEDKISVAKFAPFMPPLLLDYDTTTYSGNTPSVNEPVSSLQTSSQNNYPEPYLKEKFVRFSYRFRYADGEFSTMAPFTQICFIPKTSSYSVTDMQKIFKKGNVYFQDDNGDADGMVNDVTGVNLNILLPSHQVQSDFDIDGIEILYKESDQNAVRSVELLDVNDSDSATGVYQYQYKSTLPYETLPADQITRVYDDVPLSALAQEVISNRVVYGNFVKNRQLPGKANKVAGLDFTVNYSAKYDTTNDSNNADFNNYYLHKEYPFHSVKQRRTYEVGVVLSDKFGRQSPVLTSTTSSSSIEVPAKSNTFNSSSWSYTDNFIHDNSPGHEDYCGDALTITFNQEIPNAYAQRSFVPLNGQSSVANYVTDIYRSDFYKNSAETPNISQLPITLYYSIPEGPISTDGTNFIATGDFLYTNPELTDIYTGDSDIYLNTGNQDTVTNNFNIYKININTTTGAVISTEFVQEPINDPLTIAIGEVYLYAEQGDQYSSFNGVPSLVTPEQTSITHPTLGQVYTLTITQFTETSAFVVGDYIKGQTKDFVKILGFEVVNGIFNLYVDDIPSLEYLNYTGNLSSPQNVNISSYVFNTYKIVPHGWYSYRVVVKQVEQEYYNVYVPNVVTIDKDDEEFKTYFPVIGDNINKVTRDVEFSNIQESGLSTSKAKIFPKILPLTSSTAASGATVTNSRSVQSNKDIIDVISIGTAKEQDLKDDNERVLSFIYEPNKNPLVAQIPYENSSVNIGYDVTSGFSGFEMDFSNASSFDKNGTILKVQSTDPSSLGLEIGDYIYGENTDLVKVLKISGDAVSGTVIECDGQINSIYVSESTLTNNKFFRHRYGIQDRLSVFETKPVKSNLDIYYETSTAGFVHELNEVVSLISAVDTVEIINTQDFREDTLFYAGFNNFQNVYAGDLSIIDVNGNNITLGDGPGQISATNAIILTETAIDLSGNPLPPQSTSNRFEIFGDTNTATFKLKPSPLFDNFCYSPDDFPTGYIFEIQLTINGDAAAGVADEVFVVPNIQINLQNVAPIIESGNNIEAQGQVGDVIHTIIAKNGSAETFLNQLGLSFRSPFMQDPNVFVYISPNLPVLGHQVIYDLEGNIIPELIINSSTGEISLTSEFDNISLLKTFQIRVSDADDYYPDVNEQNQGGLYVDHTITLTISDGLLVLNGINPFSTSTWSNTIDASEGSTNIAGVNMFNNWNDNFTNYGTYWTSFANYNQLTNMPQIAPLIEDGAYGEAGIFICGYKSARTGLDNFGGGGYFTNRIWALKVENNEPKVVMYKFDVANGSAPPAQFPVVYLNHALFDQNGFIATAINGRLQVPFDGNNPDSPLDIDGPGGSTLIADDEINMNLLSDYDWNADQPGSHQVYGSPNGTGGSFEYYTGYDDSNGNPLSESISKPLNRSSSNFYQYLIKAKDEVTINNVDYHILYDVQTYKDVNSNSAVPNNIGFCMLTKVFLCRKFE